MLAYVAVIRPKFINLRLSLTCINGADIAEPTNEQTNRHQQQQQQQQLTRPISVNKQTPVRAHMHSVCVLLYPNYIDEFHLYRLWCNLLND